MQICEAETSSPVARNLRGLVGGGRGSLMQRVIPLLLDRGYQVLGWDCQPRRGRGDCELRRTDLRSAPEAETVAKGADVVIQSAAPVS